MAKIQEEQLDQYVVDFLLVDHTTRSKRVGMVSGRRGLKSERKEVEEEKEGKERMEVTSFDNTVVGLANVYRDYHPSSH